MVRVHAEDAVELSPRPDPPVHLVVKESHAVFRLYVVLGEARRPVEVAQGIVVPPEPGHGEPHTPHGLGVPGVHFQHVGEQLHGFIVRLGGEIGLPEPQERLPVAGILLEGVLEIQDGAEAVPAVQVFPSLLIVINGVLFRAVKLHGRKDHERERDRGNRTAASSHG